MTLIVSLRIPDGIVIAGDSLATMINQMELQGDIEIDCPECGHKHIIHPKLPFATPATTFSFAQKVFPFMKKFGVGTFGLGMLTGKSIYFAIRQLEQKLTQLPPTDQPQGVTHAAEKIGENIHSLLIQQIESEGKRISDMPDASYPLGFQVVGYDDDIATTVEVHIGKEVKIRQQTTPGCTFSGQGEVVQAIWSLYKNPTHQPPFNIFSMQDAIHYAKFLIDTTASHQQFSKMIPTVGGSVDVALVTPFDNFRWIQQKNLGKVLGDKNG